MEKDELFNPTMIAAMQNIVDNLSLSPLITDKIKEEVIIEMEQIVQYIQQPDTDDLAYIRLRVKEQFKNVINLLTD